MEKQPRVSNRIKKRYLVRFGRDKLDGQAFTKNISPTGLCLKTNSVFRPDTTVQVKVQLSGEEAISMWAKVVWAKKVPPQLAHVLDCGMGLVLIDPSPEWEERCTGLLTDH